MERSKNKEIKANRYWKIFIPLLIFLLLSLPYPIRIGGGNTFFSFIFYGIFFYIALRIARRLYQQYHWQFRRLLLVILLCVCLAGWQLIYLIYLGSPNGGSFADYLGSIYTLPDNFGSYWFSPLITDEAILCHNIREDYWGTEIVAIRYHSEHEPWPVCGG